MCRSEARSPEATGREFPEGPCPPGTHPPSFTSLLATANLKHEATETVVVDRVLHQLTELDPDNQEFRYATRQDGTVTMSDVDHLDIDQIHAAMMAFDNSLEAVESSIDAANYWKHERALYE